MTGIAIAVAALVAIGIAAWLWGRRSAPRDRRPPYLIALGALVDGDQDRAFRELKNAVRLDSSNVDAYLRLGDLFRERGDAERALQLHRELTTRAGLDDATRARVQMALCRDLVALDRLEMAAEAGREAVKRATNAKKALTLLKEVHELRGDPDESFKTLRELYRREGREKTAAGELAAYRAEQARELLDAGRLQDAERLLKDARRYDSTAERVLYLQGLVREKEGDYDGAIQLWQELLSGQPEEVVTIFRALERVHFLNGTYSDMEATYQRFLERVPGHEEASFGFSRFLRRKGQVDAALDVCRSALDQHPTSEELRVLFLSLLVQSGRSAEAETRLQSWISEILGEETQTSPSSEKLFESLS